MSFRTNVRNLLFLPNPYERGSAPVGHSSLWLTGAEELESLESGFDFGVDPGAGPCPGLADDRAGFVGLGFGRV